MVQVITIFQSRYSVSATSEFKENADVLFAFIPCAGIKSASQTTACGQR